MSSDGDDADATEEDSAVGKGIALGISVGSAVGVTIGSATGDIGLWLPMNDEAA